MTRKALLELITFSDQLSKKKNGNWIIRIGFFYTHGNTSDKYAERLKTQVPTCTIIDHGQHWAPFRGGAKLSNSSHFWVEFTS